MNKKTLTISIITIIILALAGGLLWYRADTQNIESVKYSDNEDKQNRSVGFNQSLKEKIYKDEVVGFEIAYPANWFIDNIDPNHGYLAIQNFKHGSRGYDVGKVISEDDLIIHFWTYENKDRKSLDNWLEDFQINPFGERILLDILSETELMIGGVKSLKREENERGNYKYYIPHKSYILVASYGPIDSNLKTEYENIIEHLKLF